MTKIQLYELREVLVNYLNTINFHQPYSDQMERVRSNIMAVDLELDKVNSND